MSEVSAARSLGPHGNDECTNEKRGERALLRNKESECGVATCSTSATPCSSLGNISRHITMSLQLMAKEIESEQCKGPTSPLALHSEARQS
jgi:hypothetical protein